MLENLSLAVTLQRRRTGKRGFSPTAFGFVTNFAIIVLTRLTQLD